MATNKKYQPKTRDELKALCDDLSIHLGDIDTSLITDMNHLFFGSKRAGADFNGIETWDVSNVEDMSFMFAMSYFNADIENWVVSSVKTMEHMFAKTPFNRPLGSWDVSNVKNMAGMFGKTPFNQPINRWKVGNVEDMNNMFYNSDFNQPLNSWDVGNVKNMCSMFCEAKSFNQPLNSWDVGNVSNMSFMFAHTCFNHPLDCWNVSNVKNMSYMFFEAQNFNQNLSVWNISNVKNFDDMFMGASITELPNWTFGADVSVGEFCGETKDMRSKIENIISNLKGSEEFSVKYYGAKDHCWKRGYYLTFNDRFSSEISLSFSGLLKGYVNDYVRAKYYELYYEAVTTLFGGYSHENLNDLRVTMNELLFIAGEKKASLICNSFLNKPLFDMPPAEYISIAQRLITPYNTLALASLGLCFQRSGVLETA